MPELDALSNVVAKAAVAASVTVTFLASLIAAAVTVAALRPAALSLMLYSTALVNAATLLASAAVAAPVMMTLPVAASTAAIAAALTLLFALSICATKFAAVSCVIAYDKVPVCVPALMLEALATVVASLTSTLRAALSARPPFASNSVAVAFTSNVMVPIDSRCANASACEYVATVLVDTLRAKPMRLDAAPERLSAVSTRS